MIKKGPKNGIATTFQILAHILEHGSGATKVDQVCYLFSLDFSSP